MMCLSHGDVVIGNGGRDFGVDVCSRAARFVKDQDLVKAVTKAPQNVERS